MSQWPLRQPDQATPIIAHTSTSTHTIDFSADGVLSIQRNELRDASKDPEILRMTEGLPNYNVLNEENINALMSVLAQAKQRIAS